MKHYFIITIIVVFLVVAVIFVWQLPAFNGLFSEIVEFFKRNSEANRPAAVSAFVALSGLSAMFSPLSSIPLVPFAIAAWGNFETFAFLLLGWLLGGGAAYAVGRYAAHPFFKKTSQYEKIKFYRKKFTPRSEFFLIVLFRFVLPAEVPGYVLGSVKYPFWKYMLATFISESPIGILTVYASKAFLEKNEIIFAISIIFGILFFLFFLNVFRKKIKEADRN